MTATVTDDVTIEFGPLEERGVLLGVSAPSMAAIGGGVLAGLATLFVIGGTSGPLFAVALIAGGLALGFVPLHGTRLADWAMVVVGFLARRMTGKHVWRSTGPDQGRHDGQQSGRNRWSAPRADGDGATPDVVDDLQSGG